MEPSSVSTIFVVVAFVYNSWNHVHVVVPTNNNNNKASEKHMCIMLHSKPIREKSICLWSDTAICHWNFTDKRGKIQSENLILNNMASPSKVALSYLTKTLTSVHMCTVVESSQRHKVIIRRNTNWAESKTKSSFFVYSPFK